MNLLNANRWILPALFLLTGSASANDLTGKWASECSDDSFGTRVTSSRIETTFGSSGSGVEKTYEYSGRHCAGDPIKTSTKAFKYTANKLSEDDQDRLDTDAELLLAVNYPARSVEDGEPLQVKIGITFIEKDHALGEALEITFKDGDSTFVYGAEELRGRTEASELKRIP